MGMIEVPRAVAPYAEREMPATTAFDRGVSGLIGSALPLVPGRLHRYRRLARRIMTERIPLRDLSDAALLQAATAARPALLRSGLSPETAVRAFALVSEATRRHLGLLHHEVQLIGGLGLLERQLVEMATGEGKTITAALAAAAAGLAGIPVHVITVNDYLAQRDAEHLGPVYAALGLRTGLVVNGQQPTERRNAYGADIVYVTNKEVAFDYLRDRLAIGLRRGVARARLQGLLGGSATQLTLRGLHFALVDEADSVLVDEARTPLIISAQNDATPQDVYRAALSLAAELHHGTHFTVLRRERGVLLTEAGREAIAEQRGRLTGAWQARRAREELMTQALTALHAFARDRDYILAEGKVQIVDESTGRTMPDRSWEAGLHQMIETKEGCEVTGRRETIARITYQRFFNRYLRLSGMTGTAREVAGELYGVFGLGFLRVPTNRPCKRRHLGARILPDEDAKWHAVAARARDLALGQGRAVLIGTRSVEASERLSVLLHGLGVAHRVLNARQTEDEAEIVAAAGQAGHVTVATNMAGRGTDIALGPGVAAAGGLHVILTEFHDSARVDRQLYGRAGRQGDPGSCEAIVALDDALFARFGRRKAQWLKAWMARTGGGAPLPAAFWLRWSSQAAAERLNAAVRRMQLTADEGLDRALAFAGPTE
ncbi:MAG: hypothetical protein U1E70_12085 [Acetobacteraceae bacterium]